jgi:hypothetical protein
MDEAFSQDADKRDGAGNQLNTGLVSALVGSKRELKKICDKQFPISLSDWPCSGDGGKGIEARAHSDLVQ